MFNLSSKWSAEVVMSYREKIAWWSLAAMLLCYIPYFSLVASGVFPGRELPDLQQLLVFGITATGHALILGLGYLWCRRQSPAEAQAPMDERDRAIEYRGTRAAYFVLMAGIILVGCVLPFIESGWSLVNTALLMIILAEVVHDGIVAASHRRQAA
jgi:hypothetical protein